MILVAARLRLEEEGLTPYRRRAKRLIYQDHVDAVYLLARDDNIPAAKELGENLRKDALVDSIDTYEYGLRLDFVAKHHLKRERAVVVCLRRKLRPTEWAVPADLQDDQELSHETFDVSVVTTELAQGTGVGRRTSEWEQLTMSGDRVNGEHGKS